MSNEQSIKALENKLNNLEHINSIFKNDFKDRLNFYSDILGLSIIILPFIVFKIVYNGQDLITLIQILWEYFLICELVLCCFFRPFSFFRPKYPIKLFDLESLDFIRANQELSSCFKGALIKNGKYIKNDFAQLVRRHIKETDLELRNLKAIELTQFFKLDH